MLSEGSKEGARKDSDPNRIGLKSQLTNQSTAMVNSVDFARTHFLQQFAEKKQDSP